MPGGKRLPLLLLFFALDAVVFVAGLPVAVLAGVWEWCGEIADAVRDDIKWYRAASKETE